MCPAPTITSVEEVTGGFEFTNGDKTIFQVFRGMRQEYSNPFYNRPLNIEASQFPLSHPNYSPSPVAPLNLLFLPDSSKTTVLEDMERTHANQFRKGLVARTLQVIPSQVLDPPDSPRPMKLLPDHPEEVV
ncbi:hypothetical protein DACRYDRAFT_107024 [Dacryopinax primogenitus]|uniref:Uncharacterized protein n=1 Tax=Dacryopinax primogenitus (strain DJM 731) TaxID=1858805 RepID=M5G884_DACPD|nr:uncharacterized protein DACRYDRAFT_107024 [Dacryopinax primogenitus]EJU02077.1 hypothetical protein DACRYDRAFT_107024 [Dacryopinax primogenitus]